jgi:hypothetical protein
LSALRPWIAAQVSLPTTTTPPTGMNSDGGGVPAMAKTLTTPGTFIASAASKLLTLPPSTGGRATTAYNIPGRRVSMPYWDLPVTMTGPSVSEGSFLPM